MCESDLKILLLSACTTHDKAALEEIIKKFSPLIKKYAYQLNYEEAESDMIIWLLEFIFNTNPSKVSPHSEGELVNYITTSLRNKKIDLYRKRSLGRSESEVKFEDFFQKQFDVSLEDTVCIYEMLDDLTGKQKTVITAKYFYGYSDSEIADLLHISRQAVNRLKSRAIEILYKYLDRR